MIQVLEVPDSSPLHGYLSPGDVIVALDGIPVNDVQQWAEVTALIDIDYYEESNYTRDARHASKGGSTKGYCIPRVLLEDSEVVRHVDNVPTCPNDLTAFSSAPCSYTGTTDYNILGDGSANTEERSCCLNAKEVIKLKKCGDGWSHIINNGSNCICSQVSF